MDILTMASQKGGSKTTLAVHLAMETERSGASPVAVVDTDPQGSLAAWWNQRAAETPLFAAVDIAHLTAHLPGLLRKGVNLAVIDTPPALTDGHTVDEINLRSRSAEEMAAFWQNVTTQLRRQNRSL